MSNVTQHILIVIVPLVLTNILHMIVVKANFFGGWSIPIWTAGFGGNKTWRGFIFVPLVNTLILVLLNFLFTLSLENPGLVGFVLGMAYMLFELPNSFLKRKFGIKPGEQHQKSKILFSMLDKMDSAFGVALTYFLLGFVDYKFAILLFILNCITHIAISWLLVVTKIKKNF